jgi:hypothetical protein
MPAQTAVRGHAISFQADPFFSEDALVDIEDALILSSEGVITASAHMASSAVRFQTVSRLPIIRTHCSARALLIPTSTMCRRASSEHSAHS